MATVGDESGIAIRDELPGDVFDEAGGGYQFNGYESGLYLDYVDDAAAVSLLVVPGGTYEIRPPPPEHNLPAVPNDGNWTPI